MSRLRSTSGWLVLATVTVVCALVSFGCNSDDDSKGSSTTEATEIIGEVPTEAGDPDATGEPEGEQELAELPQLARAETDQSIPEIRGSGELTVNAWLETVVNDVATFWQQTLNTAGKRFDPVNYEIFDTTHRTDCPGDRVVHVDKGPFYCTARSRIYLSSPYFQSFYGKIGDTAMAIPIAHEMGHHLQNMYGILDDLTIRSIDIELQADCLAGVWADSVSERNLLEPGDIAEALQSRVAVADPPGTSPNDPQAHGTPEQRQGAFLAGLAGGRTAACVPQ